MILTCSGSQLSYGHCLIWSERRKSTINRSVSRLMMKTDGQAPLRQSTMGIPEGSPTRENFTSKSVKRKTTITGLTDVSEKERERRLHLTRVTTIQFIHLIIQQYSCSSLYIIIVIFDGIRTEPTSQCVNAHPHMYSCTWYNMHTPKQQLHLNNVVQVLCVRYTLSFYCDFQFVSVMKTCKQKVYIVHIVSYWSNPIPQRFGTEMEQSCLELVWNLV